MRQESLGWRLQPRILRSLEAITLGTSLSLPILHTHVENFLSSKFWKIFWKGGKLGSSVIFWQKFAFKITPLYAPCPNLPTNKVHKINVIRKQIFVVISIFIQLFILLSSSKQNPLSSKQIPLSSKQNSLSSKQHFLSSKQNIPMI